MTINIAPYISVKDLLKKFGQWALICVSNLNRNPDKYKTIMGIDSSSLGVAWTIIIAGKPKHSGKIDLKDIKGWNNKMQRVCDEFPNLLNKFKPDHVFIERAIYINNAATARVLAYMVGALVALIIYNGYECTDIEPMVGKMFCGYTKLNRRFTAMAKKKLGRLKGDKLCKELRKSQIQRVIKFNFPNFDVTDNDITDSASIGLWGYNQLVKEIKLRKEKTIALDMPYLESLGLKGLL